MKTQLEELARARDPEARSKLISTISAQYAGNGEMEPTETEKQLFSAIVLDLFDQLSAEARLDIVVRLAKTDRITSALANRLSREPFEISEPVLRYSPVVSDNELANVVRTCSNAHRFAIACRKTVREMVVEPLIARGNMPVLAMLLQNLGTDFSAKALLAMLIHVQTDSGLLALFAKRCLEDEAFRKDIRLIIETDCPLIPLSLTQAFENDTLDVMAEQAIITASDEVIEVDSLKLSRHEAQVHIASGELTMDSILLALLSQKNMMSVIWLLARQFNMTEQSIANTLKSDAATTVARMMLNTGINHKTYQRFLEERCAWLDRTDRQILNSVQQFKGLRASYIAKHGEPPTTIAFC